MFITGPQVIKQVTGEEVSAEDLGGAQSQMHYSGVVHLIARDDDEAIELCRRLLSFLPANNVEDPPRLPFSGRMRADAEMSGTVPVDPKVAYDVRDVIVRVVDNQDFLEIQPEFAANMVIGFGRLQGRPVGIVANQPCVTAGALDIDAGIFAGRGAGARGDHPARGQAAVRLFGGHGAQDHRGSAQGLWRRIHCHVLEGTGGGPCSGLAYSGDCGDGGRGRGGDRLPQGD